MSGKTGEAKVTETMMKENTTNVVGQNKSLGPGPLPKGLPSKLHTHSVPGEQLSVPQVAQGHLS